MVQGDDAYFPVVHAQNGKPSGILPTVLERIATLTGDHYDIRLFPWKRAYELAVRGESGVVGFEGVINSLDELRSKRAALDRFDAALEKLRKNGELKKLTTTAK